MRLRAVLTDLDGTVLEADGSLLPEAAAAYRRLVATGVPVCPVTSKTADEVGRLLETLGVAVPAGCENGGVVRRRDGVVELHPGATPFHRLRAIATDLRRATGAPLTSLDELSDRDLTDLTGLEGRALERARSRVATLPLLVEPQWDERLRAALPSALPLRLERGNRFLHLQGRHGKEDAVPRLLELLAPGTGKLVASGDAPNDLRLLQLAEVRVVVPGADGPNADLVAALPGAIVARWPHGRGWAAALLDLLAGRM
jgi:mannosyl-3-phosphoglycerate phosphatase